MDPEDRVLGRDRTATVLGRGRSATVLGRSREVPDLGPPEPSRDPGVSVRDVAPSPERSLQETPGPETSPEGTVIETPESRKAARADLRRVPDPDVHRFLRENPDADIYDFNRWVAAGRLRGRQLTRSQERSMRR